MIARPPGPPLTGGGPGPSPRDRGIVGRQSPKVDIVFTAPVRPGLTLVRTIELFDEVGAPLDDPTDLHEDVISDFLPPATAAGDGVLNV